MKRGEIFATVGKGDFSTKPRPSLIVQSDAFNPHHGAITVCPISTERTDSRLFRVPITADETTNLLADSEVSIDLVQAIRRERFGRRIGVASDETMLLVDDALRRWLSL